jgi:hypothetical protein
MWKKLIELIRAWYESREDKKQDKPTSERKWRRDLATISAKDGKVTFYTRNLSIPIGDGRNKDGGFEWIISRIRGDNYERLLLMVMGGSRPPSRIWFNHKPFTNNAWQMPLIREAKWEVYTDQGNLIVKLDGNTIWTAAGPYTVRDAVMGGYANRLSTGEWSL